MRRRTITAAVILVTGAGLASALNVAGIASTSDSDAVNPGPRSAGQLQAPGSAPDTSTCPPVPIVDAGASFDGTAAEHQRGCGPPPEERITGKLPAPQLRINMQMVAYPNCDQTGSGSEDQGGCLPPQVQTWPACERNLALYEQNPGPAGPVPFTRATMRGVPAATFDDGHRIELYTKDVTVVVFADSPGQARALVARLQSRSSRFGSPVAAGEDFPTPSAGAVTGELKC